MSQLFLFADGQLGKPEDSIGLFSGKSMLINHSKSLTADMLRKYVYVDEPKVQWMAPEGVDEEKYLLSVLGSEEAVTEFMEGMDCPDFKPMDEGIDPIMEMLNTIWKVHGFPGVLKRKENYQTGRGQMWVFVSADEFEWPKQFIDIHQK